MKQIIGLLIVLMMLTSVTVGLAGGTTATDTKQENVIEYKKTLNIVTPEPVIETCWDHDVLSISGYNFMIEPSVPMLPMKTVSLVIPQSAEIKSIKVLSSTKEKMRGDYDILPVQEPVPVSRNTPVAFTPKNPLIYSSSNHYPGKLIEYAGEGNLRDYRILSINVYPLQYNPAGKKLTYYNNIEIEVTYTAPPANAEKTEDDEFSKMVKAMVSNPEDVDTLSITTTEATPSILTGQDVDYVIITSAAFEDEFQTLVDHKISKGLTAEVVTLMTISDYSGIDTQERIRNFIIDAKATWGTKWILLGGDTDIIPPRLAYSMRENIPTDLYYSDLDGTWNADGDSIYGERRDNIDLYPDVFVGRAPVNTITEAGTFVSKTIAYELGPSGYETTALFMAEYLDENTDGGIAKNMIDSESIPDTFTVTKLYESLENLNYNSAMAELNEGYGIINHIGHANYNVLGIGQSALYNTNMDSLTNSPKNSIFYSIGCWSNALDRDSIAEHFVLNQNGGGIAYIGNSRYGWYSPGSPGYGTSERYDREFFKSLFTEDLDNIGETLADSKATYVPSSQRDGTYRYIQYALNLLGDPETTIWTSSDPVIPDAEDPEITDITGDISTTTGDSVDIVVNATDNVDPTSAKIFIDGAAGIGMAEDPEDTFTYVYTAPSDSVEYHNYSVMVYDNAGNSVTSLVYEITVTDNDAPTANAGPDQIVVIEDGVAFDGSSSSDNIDILSYSWDFDDSNGISEDATDETSTHKYSTLGTYNVTLTVRDEAGYTDSDTLIVNVIEEMPTMHIASIDVSFENPRYAGPNIFGYATAVVTIVNGTGIPVNNATVSGQWSGATSDSDSGETNTTGTVSLHSDTAKVRIGDEFTFRVTNVICDGLMWDEQSMNDTTTAH